MSKSAKPRETEIYFPNNCPHPYDALHKADSGESLVFGEISTDWGMWRFPLGKGFFKVEVFHPETRGLKFGIWDVPGRRAIFCNVDHPGLYPAFIYHYGYERKGWLCRFEDDQARKRAAAPHIVEICFPFHLSSFDRDRDLLRFSFKDFVELMKPKFEEHDFDILHSAIISLRDKFLAQLDEHASDRRAEIYRREKSEASFPKDDELIRITMKKAEITTRFNNALELLA